LNGAESYENRGAAHNEANAALTRQFMLLWKFAEVCDSLYLRVRDIISWKTSDWPQMQEDHECYFFTCPAHYSYVQLYHWYGKGQYDHALKLLDDIGVLPRTQSDVSSKVALFKSTQEVCDIRVLEYELYCPDRLVRLREIEIADQALVYS
jgi:hypothetical protein